MTLAVTALLGTGCGWLGTGVGKLSQAVRVSLLLSSINTGLGSSGFNILGDDGDILVPANLGGDVDTLPPVNLGDDVIAGLFSSGGEEGIDRTII